MSVVNITRNKGNSLDPELHLENEDVTAASRSSDVQADALIKKMHTIPVSKTPSSQRRRLESFRADGGWCDSRVKG